MKTRKRGQRLRVGFFGGSFNPPHMGHVLAAVYAKQVFQLDQVWLAPVDTHAFSKDLLPFKHRMAMCRLAIQGLGQGFKVSPIESQIDSQGRSLMVLRHLRQLYPQTSLTFIVGSDTLKDRSRWYKFDVLEREFELCVVPRQGASSTPKTMLGLPNISSTAIRRAPQSKQSIRWVPPAVLNYYLSLKGAQKNSSV